MKYLIAVLLILLSIQAFASRMAAMGNSISAGVFASSDSVKSWKEKLVERPSYNFATGSKVNSHCSRLNHDFGNFECRNFAVSGSTIEDLFVYQLDKVLDYNPDYVVIEVGSNNVCDDNPISARMFYNIFSSIAYNIYRDGRAVVVVGIPDISHLLSHANKRGVLGIKAKTLWKIFGHCSPILKDKQNRRDIIAEYNNALRDISKAYGFYFAEGVANVKFDYTLISKFDAFHPSRKGQEFLAAMSYPFKGEK